MFNVASAL